MPLYEYECPDCGRFEVIQKFSDKPLKQCPNCKEKGKSNPVTKAVSASAFHLKGSGWYKTDYSSGSSSSGGSSKKSKGSKSESSKSDSSGSSDSSATTTPKKACGSGCGCH
jgi:putative FmdB family regulatory protein